MWIWIANKYYGVSFRVEDRKYGYTVATDLGGLIPWRRRVYDAAIRAVGNPWVHKHGYQWELLKKKENQNEPV